MKDVTIDNYQEQAERTSATGWSGKNHPRKNPRKNYMDIVNRLVDPQTIRLLHGAMGLDTESGELMDALKSHIFYGKELDLKNISEECGDLFWYLAETLTAMDEKFIDVMQRNIDKLRVRYPEKFTEENALNRKIEEEKKVL